MKQYITIALDGPSGSGKSTAAKGISEKLNILYLDTGAMYRACGLKAKKCGVSCKDEHSVKSFIGNINIEIKYIDGVQHTFLDGEDVSFKIRENEVSMLASDISALQCVRQKMVELQREIAAKMSCVLDGRDIGTHVLPNAKYKFYINASSEVRAERRRLELLSRGQDVPFEQLKNEIEQRDYNDSHREFSPLRKAEDAIEIDTSNLTANEVLNLILNTISEV